MKKLALVFGILATLSFTTQEVKTVQLKFTVEEVQLVYDALGELPAKKVEVLRNRIAMEAQRQLADTTKKK